MITAIAVNYRTLGYLEKLLQRLKNESLIREIIMVDNSPEPEIERLERTRFKNQKIRTIISKKNQGLAEAVNRAAVLASHPVILLINPDVLPIENSISHLYEQARKNSACLAGPRFYLDEEKRFRLPPAEGFSLFWSFAHKAAQIHPMEAKLFSFYWQLRHDRFWQAEHPFFEPFLAGACLLIDRDKLQSEKLFDDRFFLYFEETDLCFEAVERGLKILLVPQAEMIHYWSQSPLPGTKKAELRATAARIFIEKHFPGAGIPTCPPPNQACEKPEFVDLGTVFPAPQFMIPPFPDVPLYLEIGINPYFVPFAQTSVCSGTVFAFPERIWERLEAREYFVRIRGENAGAAKAWRLLKPETGAG